MSDFTVRSLCIAAHLLILVAASTAHADLTGEVRGKMVDRSLTAGRHVPPSAERDMESLCEASGLDPSEVEIICEGAGTLPKTSPRLTRVIRDEPQAALFESGSAELTPLARAQLDEILSEVRNKQNLRIAVTGHTDNQHIRREFKSFFRDNRALSLARALAVAKYIKDSAVVGADRLAAEGKGERRPLASNGTEAGRAANRRVEIRIWFDEAVSGNGVPSEEGQAQPETGSEAGTVQDMPFRISIDRVVMGEEGRPSEADRERRVDVALEKADIRVRYDPLAIAPALNVWTTPNGTLATEPVTFYSHCNYALWVHKAEVRIFLRGQSIQKQPFAVLPLAVNDSAVWTVPANAPENVYFLLRVYDEKGRFDETALKELAFVKERPLLSDRESPERERLIGYGENSRTLANIPVRGGFVTVDGDRVKAGSTVTAFGIRVPVDGEGKFASRQIMPAGPHTVEVSVADESGCGMIFRRNVSIPKNDWFYVALADITFGGSHTTGPAKLLTRDTTAKYEKDIYIDGRGAFYLKGLIKGEYLLTASADTRERPLKDLFSNFDSKDPMYLLRRIDPDLFYPVYGDDSTIVDDAPTQGKFYVRVDRGDSHVMWGNFQTEWTGTELTQYSRGLYGANLVIAPQGSTSYGERKTRVNAFVAEPGTLAARDEFRGTGGSLYYLRHMDITEGSERVWVEIRDKDSLFTIERYQLAPALDYDVNYLQGRIILRAPLPSVADGSTLIQTSTLSGNPVYLVATYEYVPGLTATSDLAGGFRASQWLGDHVRLGVTGYRQGEDDSKQWLGGADVFLRYKPGTYLKGEFARSDGPGTSTLSSITGGFDFNEQTGADDIADAWRLEGALDLSEVWEGARGRFAGYWQNREGGFSAPGQIALDNERMEQMGFAARVPVGERSGLYFKGDARDSDSQTFMAAEGGVRHKLNDEFTVSGGIRADDRDVSTTNVSETLSEEGERAEAIVRVDYRRLAEKSSKRGAKASPGAAPMAPDGSAQPAPADPEPASPLGGYQTDGHWILSGETRPEADALKLYEPWGLYGFAQATLWATGSRSDNNRFGLGGDWQMTSRFKIGGEVSEGDGGLGGKLLGDYRIDDRSNVYMAFTNESERPESVYRGQYSTLVFGSSYRFSDQARVFNESRWGDGAGPDSLVHAYGMDLAPNDRWTVGLKAEQGTISDEASGDLDRVAVGVSAAYKYERTKLATALEYRDESGTSGDRDVWLMKSSAGYQIDPSWRLLGKFNFSVSESSGGEFFDADFTEAVVGAAFRPVKHDRLNALFKYTYFYTLPSPGQRTASDLVPDYAQNSHVLSIDGIYDLWPWLSVGAKYGMRFSELKQTKTTGDWFSSTADLVILRADLHLVREWDGLVEWRRLRATEAEDVKMGFLVGLYRHLTDHVKVGVGYNFTDFSDDMTDLSYENRGWFVNVVSAF